MQPAGLVKPDQKLWRPALRTHIRGPQNALAPRQFEDEAALVHGLEV